MEVIIEKSVLPFFKQVSLLPSLLSENIIFFPLTGDAAHCITNSCTFLELFLRSPTVQFISVEIYLKQLLYSWVVYFHVNCRTTLTGSNRAPS